MEQVDPFDVVTAGCMAVFAPEGILGQPGSRTGDVGRLRQHAAIVAASPVLWLRLLAVRGPLWRTEVELCAPPIDPLLPDPDTDDEAKELRRARPMRRILGPATINTYEDLPDEVRAGLVPVAEQSGLPLPTLMHVAYWAWIDGRRLFVYPPPEPGGCSQALGWREEGKRTKHHLAETLIAMRLRWLKKARVPKEAGLIGSYYRLSSDGEVQQAAVTRRIDRVERQIPEPLRPDLGNAEHRHLVEAMGRYLKWRRSAVGSPARFLEITES